MATPKPRVLVNSPLIEKRPVLKTFIGGTVKKIQKGDYHPSPGDEIAVLGQSDVWLLTATDYAVVGRDDFGGNIAFGLSPQLIDAEGDGTHELMKGGGGFGEVGLINNRGEQLWTFHPHPKLAPEKMMPADLNEDGALEFYVADGTGLYQLNSDGTQNWKVAGQHFYAVGLTPENTVLGLDKGNEIVTVNFEGQVVSRFNFPNKTYDFDVVEWPEETGVLIGYFGKRIQILDLNGDIVFQHKLDNFPLYHAPQGLSIHLNKDEPPYLAVLAHSRSSVGLSQLTIFSPSGKLLYQEILGSTRGLCANIDTATGAEVLLVGNGTASVLEYRLKQKRP